ncbi:AraC family transcriptional regulator [Aquisphaera insulae]|uniref:AraC family transcriptional regulator n=1 Tax=Aquisphaera insulae TaxID=2712864 RepID=UPI0013ECB46B|nr:xylose operon transcription regulator XylR [Aquisphaera insulae]
MSRIPKVALLIETSRGYGRGLLRGIVRYARLHGPWGFYLTPGDFAQVLPRMQSWGGTGIIARVETAAVARAILESGLPAIALDLAEEEMRPEHPLGHLAEVESDSAGAGRLAAEHLLGLGFRNHAYVGTGDRVWSLRRRAAFVDRIREAGFEPHVYEPPRSARDRSWGREQPILSDWLCRLPRPAGLMACDDDRGRQVLEACRAGGLVVPEQIAVVGVDDDELLCELADPPLSSVALNAEAGGYRAAAMLDRMMRAHAAGCRPPRRRPRPARLVVEALRVVPRRSTDVIALDDPEVAAALHFLHNHAGEPIGVADVVADRLISRRSLEMRFRATVGHTIHDELQRIRLERARRLLLETDLPIPGVARAAGFSSPSYLAQVFRRALRTTPARYRRESRTPSH